MAFLKSNIHKIFIFIIVYMFCNISSAQTQDPNNNNVQQNLNKKNLLIQKSPNTPKKIVIIGAPASGKGTQAKFISEEFNIPQISTGDMLRAEVAAGSAIGKKIKSVMDAGQLVDDSIIMQILKQRLAKDDTKNGFILDGFPRTINQAQSLDSLNIKINYVIELDVPDQEIIKRISGRRVHPQSGRTYHTEYNPPKKAGVDDVTSETLVQRDDDKEDSVKKRLKSYHEQTEPVISWYKKLSQDKSNNLTYIAIDGTKDIQVIKTEISNKLNGCYCKNCECNCNKPNCNCQNCKCNCTNCGKNCKNGKNINNGNNVKNGNN